MTCLSTFPVNISAGLSFQASMSQDIANNYPSPAWALSALLRGPSVINMAAVNGIFSADAVTTAEWSPGTYLYSIRATSGLQVLEVESGSLVINPDFSALPAGFDTRTPNQIALDSINAVLAKRATQDQQRYSINNRELWRTPIHELIKLQAFYQAKVRMEQRRTKTFGRSIKIRFTSP